MSQLPLQYNISDWSQLVECLSNNSRDLRITVSTFIGNVLHGNFISVIHKDYGVVFSAMTSGGGDIVSDTSPEGQPIPWMTKDEILTQLAKFGFLVTFRQQAHLPVTQIVYLVTLKGLGYQHIGPMNVRMNDGSVFHYVLAFDGTVHPELLTANTTISYPAFVNALKQGEVVNVSEMASSLNMVWDWLTYVANIQDILDENSED